ncbi:MAG TPA: hypothetical protein VGE07_16730 [Herpetosiphonaceae bacterium]
MVTHVSIAEAQHHLPDLLAAAAAGATIVIDAGPNGQFQLLPLAISATRLEYGSMRGQIQLSDDFDDPLDDFADYM